MMDMVVTDNWCRKHLFDVASACKTWGEEPTLSITQRKVFAKAYGLARQLSSLPDAGGASNVAAVIHQMCSACQDANLHKCSGRDKWQHPCSLIQNA